MYLSRNWLKEYINIDSVDSQTLSDKISLTGLEVEGFDKLIDVEGLVIGKVESLSKHPEADKLNIAQVNVGNEVLQIVCGAPNVVENAYVIVAKVGVKLPQVEIKQAKIRGVESNGMLCALQELGLDDKFVDEKYREGIYLFENTDVEIGTNPLEVLNFQDEVLDISITPNRSDALSMFGLAYEVGAIFNQKFKLPEVTKRELGTWQNINIVSENASVYYTGLAKDVVIKPSPLWMQAYLIANNVRPISNVVDITNFVMLETGQPLHAFDKDTVKGSIIVRQANIDETLETLDGKVRNLEIDDLVIADDRGAIALAGVMGGSETEVTSKTTTILLESAYFNDVSIRKTSNKFNLRSEASLRFEKIIDPQITQYALLRALDLLEKYASANIESTIVKTGNELDLTSNIDVTYEFINKKLGTNLQASEIKQILLQLQIDFSDIENGLCVHIPSRRHEMTIKEDVVEEIGRIYGYEKIAPILPKLDLVTVSETTLQKLKKKITKSLVGKGFSENLTYSLVSQSMQEVALIDEIAQEQGYKLMSPLSDERSHFRKSHLPSTLQVINYNLSRQMRNLQGFEMSQIHTFVSKENEVYVRNILSMYVVGDVNSKSAYLAREKASYAYLQRNLLQVLAENGLFDVRFSKVESPYFQPGITAVVEVNGQAVGLIGKVNPQITAEYEVNDSVYYCEILIENLKMPKIKYHPVTKFPKVERDLAFVINKDQQGQTLIDTIFASADSNKLKDVVIFDLYENERIGNDKISVSVKLTFESREATLETKDVDAIVERVVNSVESKFETTFRK